MHLLLQYKELIQLTLVVWKQSENNVQIKFHLVPKRQQMHQHREQTSNGIGHFLQVHYIFQVECSSPQIRMQTPEDD